MTYFVGKTTYFKRLTCSKMQLWTGSSAFADYSESDLHWLPVHVRYTMNFKIATIIFKVLQFQQPSYLAVLIPRYVPTRSLWFLLPCQYMFLHDKPHRPSPSLWPSGIGSRLGRNRLWVRFLTVSDIYPMFIEPTITWSLRGSLGTYG